MADSGLPLLTAWESFYVILGSSSAALIGLMFVVVTLLAGDQAVATTEGVSAFGAPTVAHFCTAFLVSAILSAPWARLWQAGLAVGLIGLAGLIYGIVILRRVRHQTVYQPVLEDWSWHILLPLAAYLTLMVAGIQLRGRPRGALFGIGAAAVLLLIIGIHNAWDNITYIVTQQLHSKKEPPP
jgi:hypothetical protein